MIHPVCWMRRAGLLRRLGIHIIGAATDDPADEIIELRNQAGELEAVVAAVPFLRERDLQYSRGGETAGERDKRLRENIKAHYLDVAERMAGYTDVPLLATGHLYAYGTKGAEHQDNIYIGNRENIAAEDFPERFAYVALGHIHRPQAVDGLARVRYSGSLIPLDFSETADNKSVVLLKWEGNRISETRLLELPVFRRLKSIRGSYEKVTAGLQRFAARGERELTPWVDVVVETDHPLPGLHHDLQELVEDHDLQLLGVRYDHHFFRENDLAHTEVDLAALDEGEIFSRRVGGEEVAGYADLRDTYRGLREWMREERDPQ